MKCTSNFEEYENLRMNGQNSENTKPADQYESVYLISVRVIEKEMLINIFKDYTISFVGCVFETSEDLNDLKICNNRTYTKIIKV